MVMERMSMAQAERAGAAAAEPPVKRIVVLGATGSIGQSTIDVIRAHPTRFVVEALVGNSNIAALARDARSLGAKCAVTADASRYEELKGLLAGSDVEAAAGEAAVLECAGRPADIVMAAIVGASGLKPTLAAVRAGTTVALANKECLVSAGALFMREAQSAGAAIIPVDSEHNAILQCLEMHNLDKVDRITLTASGGPFRTTPLTALAGVGPQDALCHPNWSMGPKVTIDSATLMNKGLEVIEAYHLFPVGLERLGVLVHPQSIVHSFVSYCDGSVLAQMGTPDMRTPIASALAWPRRIATPVERLDLARIASLTFEAVDHDRFPAVNLCRAALQRGGSATTILNAANEVAVAEFLSQRLRFPAITALVEATLSRAEGDAMIAPLQSLDDVWAADGYGRSIARELACGLENVSLQS
jgi:1-deoxy-D-xylulose-5-phosphate reductoisomerase